MVANLIKVKVCPRDFKAIPDVLPYNKLLQGEPVEMELSKREILRCMNFGDVFDMTSGEEVLIDEISFKDIVEFVEDEEAVEDETPVEEPVAAKETTSNSSTSTSTEIPED